MKNAVSVLATCLLACSWAVAQAQQPTPSAQHQRMGYFAGSWKAEGMMKLRPNGALQPNRNRRLGE
jgi:hypothetical protein